MHCTSQIESTLTFPLSSDGHLIATGHAMKTGAGKFRAPCCARLEEAITADLLGNRVPACPRDGINWEEGIVLRAHHRTGMAVKEETSDPDKGI